MLNTHEFVKKILLMGVGVVLMTTLVTSAKADDRVTRTHTFDLSDVMEVEFTNSVGSLEIVPSSGTEMRIVLDIESERGGFFRRPVDVDNMDLEARERGDTLFLSFEEKNVSARWVVEMPRVEHTVIHMGVGELRLEVGATDLDVEMGVGDVTVEAPAASVGRVNLNVGVGDISFRGGDVMNRDAAFISQRIRAQGDGTHPLEIDLGVGDLKVRLD